MIVNKLFLNNNPASNPNLSLVKARNVRFNDDFEFLTNEEGFDKLHTFPAPICGDIATDIEHIIFCTDSNGTDYIYRVNDTTSTLSLKGNLSLSEDHPITGEFQYNNLGELIVVFNDANNELRIFNFDNPYMELDANKEFVNVEEGINKLRLFPHFNTPIFNHDDSNPNNNGNLPKGTYHIILSYYVGEHDRLNWSIPSLPYTAYKTIRTKMWLNAIESTSKTRQVMYDDYFQDESEEITDNAIELTIGNLDTRYSKYKLGLIYRTETITRAYDLGDYNIDQDTHTITKLTDVELSLDEVTIPYVNIGVVEDLTISNDRIATLGNKTTNELDYQKYANNIKVEYYPVRNDDWYTGVGIIPESFEVNPFSKIHVRTPIWDEVYALNIGLIGKDGTVKGIYHIPGRAPKAWKVVLMENYPVMDQDKENYNITGNNDVIYNAGVYGSEIDPTVDIDYYYQLYNTADQFDGGYSDLAYWENRNEEYPDKEDFQVWDVDANGVGTQVGTLVGEKVRHHKMPSLEKTTGYFYNENNATKRSISLRFTNIKFPKEILDEISGYFICFSDRTSDNATVHGTYPTVRDNFYTAFPLGTADPSINKRVKTFRFNNESILEYKPALSKPYLRGLYVADANLLALTYPAYDGIYPTSYVPDSTNIKSWNSEIRHVKAYHYIPKDNVACDPANKGREEALALETDIPFDDRQTTDVLVCELKSDLDDVYKPFYNRRVSIASTFKPITEGSYDNYYANDIRYLDGFISHHRQLHYLGDRTFTVDEDDGSITREGSATDILIALSYFNCSVLDSHLMSRDITNIAVGADAINIAGLPGSKFNGIAYFGNIVSDPSKDFGFIYHRYHSYTDNIVAFYTKFYDTVSVSNHPFRVYRSAVQGKEDLTLNWRYFSALEYHEMPKHRGNGVSISGVDKMLLIHMEHSLFIAQAKDRIELTNGDAYVGTADIFERRPDELVTARRGTAGIQSRFGNCVGTFGYMFADTYDQSIYSYSNKAIDIITDDTVRGLYKKYMPVVSANNSNPLNNNDVIFGIDERNKRIIITSLGDTKFTMSYSYEAKTAGFVAFHDYIPAIMTSNRLGTYSVNRDNRTEFHKFNSESSFAKYYDGVQKESYIDVLVNENPRSDKIINSVSMQSGIYDDSNYIHKLFIYNRNKCSKVYNLEEFAALSDFDKIRYLGDFWNYDLIRDYTSNLIPQNIVNDFGVINDLAINETKNWYELGDIAGRYFIVRLITNNSADMIFRDLEYNVMLNRR